MILSLLEEKRDLKNKLRVIDEILTYVISKTKLTDIEKTVIDYRIDKGMTLKDSGAYLGLTRERVRQLERNAVEKIANNRAWSHKKVANLIAVIDLF